MLLIQCDKLREHDTQSIADSLQGCGYELAFSLPGGKFILEKLVVVNELQGISIRIKPF